MLPFFPLAVATVSREWVVLSVYFSAHRIAASDVRLRMKNPVMRGQDSPVVALTDYGSCYEGDEG